MKLWKRNAVVAAIVLFVGAAVYLNWSYTQEMVATQGEEGKLLGEAALVGATTDDPLISGTPTGDSNEITLNTQSAYFDSARLNRQQARDSALSLLQEAAGDEKADQATIDNANATIQSMATFTLSEANIENLVIAKGYAQCVAFLSDNSISVVVSNSGAPLTDVDTAKISEIVSQETGLAVSQMKIIETE